MGNCPAPCPLSSNPKSMAVPVYVMVERCALRSCDAQGKNYPVYLAVSEFQTSNDWAIVNTKAYHTSILLGGYEVCFKQEGIVWEPWSDDLSSVPPSHVGKGDTKVVEVGRTSRHTDELVRRLDPFFGPGSYDILAKNCNSFTDVCLAYLVSRRLPGKLVAAEKLGQSAPSMLLSWVSGGKYQENESARGFNVEAVILQVDPNAWMGLADVDRFTVTDEGIKTTS
eukprot:TRINITY_DN2667_c3_g1_i1.p1 TRINITY_DN2667_c3_g1~~TRINITY_DN2667_c3_g1_i1.p1  ORF type:complete len:225 (-),score=27.41 TRINITY_DN2667_c3_g1_i1:248-922(-)